MVKTKEILIIEDEVIIAKDIKSILGKNGFVNIQIVTNYHDAVNYLNHNSPFLIICDIYLKGNKTGIDIIEGLCSPVKTPVVYVSAYSDDKTLDRAFKTKPASYITKPFTESQLLTVVKYALSSNIDLEKYQLTTTEKTVIQQLALSKSTKEIANELNRSYETINNHKRNIFKKLDIHKLSELITFALENGLN